MERANEAKLVQTEHGKIPEGEGWFILNMSDARWWKNDKFGSVCRFEGETRFPHYGINVRVLEPGQPACHYHAEEEQEDFLILQGECKVILEGREWSLKQWDLVHCSKGTRHVFVGAGKGPSVILMVGSRTEGEILYPIDPGAQKYDACAPNETDSPEESYREVKKREPVKAEWPLRGSR